MGDWSTFSSLENPDLVRLASSLPDIALRARAPSTVASYIRAFQLWATWASSYDLASLPADTSHICLCFAYLIQSARTCSPVISAAAAAQSWANEKAGSPDPVQASIIQQVLKGARRTLAKPRLKKNPIKVDDIRKLLQHWNGPDAYEHSGHNPHRTRLYNVPALGRTVPDDDRPANNPPNSCFYIRGVEEERPPSGQDRLGELSSRSPREILGYGTPCERPTLILQNRYIECRPNIAHRPDDILKGAGAAANVLPEGGGRW